MRKYWTLADAQRLKKAKTFEELAEIALAVLKRIPQPVGIVSGPISTGGLGSKAKNIVVFKKTIKNLKKRKLNIFDQMPFEPEMWRIERKPCHADKKPVVAVYDGNVGNHLLEVFYLPIFESGLLQNVYFIKGWESSKGAMWECNQAIRLGLDIMFLDNIY